MASIIYVTRDIERALGKTPENDYYIITNKTPYATEIQELYPHNVFLIDSKEILDTFELLNLKEVQEIIGRLNASILVFKNTIHIEQYCKENGWKLLNSSAELSEKIENKISQVKWLAELDSLLPPHKILEVKDIVWNMNPFILQWSHGHTGYGTILIQNEKDLNDLKEKFPYREARITDFIQGPMFTVNIVVTKTVNLLGNISYQITGMLPFTNNPFSTIGNDWSLPHTILTEAHVKRIEEIAEKVAQKMQKDGWKGLFGIDVIYDEERDMIHLIEINARQPASTTFESELQSIIRSHGVNGSTIFEAHIASLTDAPVVLPIIPINDGAQILQRVMDKPVNIDVEKLVEAGFKVIKYINTKPNEDLLRIQTTLGIIETHNKFNGRGKKIMKYLLV